MWPVFGSQSGEVRGNADMCTLQQSIKPTEMLSGKWSTYWRYKECIQDFIQKT
jgi:hypothetical protein